MNSEVTESTGFLEFLAWLEVNKKRLIITAVVLVVVGLGIAVYRWNVIQHEEAAYAALFRVGLPLTPGERAVVPTASSYLKLAGDYPGTRAGQQALILAAGEYFKSGEYDQARAQFQAFLDQYGASALAPTASFGLASALDALNRLDEAQRAYQDVVARYPTSPVVAQARLALARLFETRNQPEQALKLYDQLTQSSTPDTWAAEARARREELLLKFPNLAQPQSSALPGPASSTPSRSVPMAAPSVKGSAAPTNTVGAKGRTNLPAGAAGNR